VDAPPGTGPSELLRATARRIPDRTAIVDIHARWSWTDLDERVNAAAAKLIAAGVRPGDRVALQLPTGRSFVAAYLATLRAGAVAVPVNPAYPNAEVEHIRADSGADVLLDPAAADELVEGPAPDTRDPRRDRGPEDLAVLLYTSGTSGRGKGAMLSARALRANVDQLAAVEPPMITGDDTLFLPLPLTHVFGLNAGLGMALRVGATLVLADRFDAAETLRQMAASGVTAVLAVPGQYAAWLAQPDLRAGFAQVRFAMSGSTTLARGVVDGYAGLGIVLHDGYGLTEAAPVVSVEVRERVAAGSVGRPLPGVDVQLRDRDGAEVDDDDPGRIFIRGANLFSGYWPDGAQDPLRTQGWFGTGDIAVTDADGALHLVGRSTDLVIVNGFNVYPAEVEAVLAGHDGVGDVAVVGVPDDTTGEAVVAYVVRAPGAQLTAADLRAVATVKLARFKVPRDIEIVSTLPRTVTGKIMKWQLDRQLDGAGD
jgi:long-chain acyl-CoA synthetase